jgi:anti-anti-sigma factor
VPVTVEQSEGLCFIRLEGEVNIICAAELKKLLLEALASGKGVRVDLKGATELDITALQLLWAGEREARASGRGLRLAGRIPEEIAAASGEAGLEKFPVAVDTK